MSWRSFDPHCSPHRELEASPRLPPGGRNGRRTAPPRTLLARWVRGPAPRERAPRDRTRPEQSQVGLALEFPQEPRPRDNPLAFHRGGRDPHGLAGLFDRQPTEEPELHEPPLFWIDGREARECAIERDDVGSPRR